MVLYDLRTVQDPCHPKTKLVNGRTFQRRKSSIDSICLHQTACLFSVSKQQIRHAQGSPEIALATRGMNIASHMTAFRNGVVVAAHPFRSWVHNCNKLNARCLGLEIEGRYPGLESDPLRTTYGGSPSELTQEVIRVARDSLTWLVETARSEGCPIEYIYAHRQSSKDRRSDPGEGLWREVVLEYGVPCLDLKVQPGFKIGTGRTLPREWGGEGNY